MTERRETGRTGRRPGKPGRKPSSAPRKHNPKTQTPRGQRGDDADWADGGERIAKYLARAGVASRREVERMIEAGDVRVDGVKLSSPAFKVTGRELIKVGRRTIQAPEPTKLWRYHKPAGLITTTTDPAGRRTVFDELPKSLPRVVTIGRLDLTTEGLLLLTNDGELARNLELPKNAMERTYRARAHGTVTPEKLDALAKGITVEGVDYQPITAILDRETGANSWLTVTLTEGKKREVRRALESLDLIVNRLIRVSYGPFLLDTLKPGTVEEVPTELLYEAIGTLMPPPPERTEPRAQERRPAAKSGLGRRRSTGRLQSRKPKT